jgi:UDP-N-acetylglucosamine--N-acetylmuramyl-(pentapeptide) pyrophosphoryl-undecaprenol N-acetylglucosamine transferase
MKLLIAVGGGGHFAPALAVVDQLPKDWHILIVGRKHTFEGDASLSLEFQTAQRLNLPYVPLTTGRVQRNFSRHTLSSLFKVPVGLAHATKIVRDFKPDVVLSFGGYVSVPVCIAAAALRIPIVIHEQTLHAGLANKVVGKFANKICISWKESASYFPGSKTILTGNPLGTAFREHLKTIHQPEAGKIPKLYVTGGSGGAHGINVLVEGALEKLLEKYEITHQTGDAQEFGDFDRLEALKATLPPELQERYTIKKFIIPEMVGSILSEADLVISRSGINTVTELLYLGKPSLLIPLPDGQRDEQQSNALFFQETGLGKMMEQATLTPESFTETIHEMMVNIDSYRSHASQTMHMIALDAAEKIIEVVSNVADKKD